MFRTSYGDLVECRLNLVGRVERPRVLLSEDWQNGLNPSETTIGSAASRCSDVESTDRREEARLAHRT